MFKKEISTYFVGLIAYLVIITALSWPIRWQILLFWLGSFCGLLLYNLDHLVYLLWQVPEEPAALELKQFLLKRDLRGAFRLLDQTSSQRKRLVGHSVIFQIVLVVLTFFALSSTSSLFGKGLVMGLFIYSLINQGAALLRGSDLSSWFWQLELRLSRNGEAFYFLALILILFFFSRILILG